MNIAIWPHRFCTGPLAGRVIEKIGPRSAVMLGGVLVMIGFAASSLATNLVTLYFTFGVVAGSCTMLTRRPC